MNHEQAKHNEHNNHDVFGQNSTSCYCDLGQIPNYDENDRVTVTNTFPHFLIFWLSCEALLLRLIECDG